MLQITSLQNPKIKQVIHLRDRPERDQTGLFLIEGYREVLRAADAGWKIESLFTCPELFLGTNEPALIKRLASRGTQLFTCSEKVFQKISYRDRPDGLIAIAPQRHLQLDDLLEKVKKPHAPLFVVAEAIEKPGNLGTILRSSDAVGVDGLIVCDRCTDIYNPNVVRASVGTLFTVPTVEAKGEETLHWLKQQGIQILAATPQAEKEFTQVDLTGPVAIAVGTEQLGLSERWMQQAHLQVRIPMMGVADSLNVAMATTLLMYEALRQRQHSFP
ncbi:TrmH family RNA methyltransferase [Candidatus Protochlamydia phocaeensis]|uniref:TrmH family RNA methyltransferase n=1 Tax=Candidatus Protochlamydia phocaeensis TaxID=1414722 RepID=UPI00083930C8|nr:RNA methyltransferase [Candidatus Protochlamydia phocaeensis]